MSIMSTTTVSTKSPPEYTTPVLNTVTVEDKTFILEWTLPYTKDGTPAGGYDIFINGSDTGTTYRTLNTSVAIADLPYGVYEFAVEARWTQADPSVFLLSNKLIGTSTEPIIIEPPSTRAPFSLRIDPNFDKTKLSSQARIWYDRLWSSINNPNQSVHSPYSGVGLANLNDEYYYARPLNTYMTTLLHVFRATGDKAVLDEIDKLAQIMRSKLKDWSITRLGSTTWTADGYLNWIYDMDNEYKGTDVHEMDEMMTHSGVAAFAYAFYVNRDLDPRYAERAAFWTDYLKNHFEAKWRARKNIPSAFPFLTKLLTHPYAQWIRYHYYMGEMTGNSAYTAEAERMAGVLKSHLKPMSTSVGAALVWDHSMGSTLGPQPTNYARYTIQAMADLKYEKFSIFNEPDFIEKISRTVAGKVITSASPASIAGDISGAGTATAALYVISPYAQISMFDSSGIVRNLSEQFYNNDESDKNNPRKPFIPGGLFLSDYVNNK